MRKTTINNYPSMGTLIDLAPPLAPHIGRNMGSVLKDPEMVEFIMSAYRSRNPQITPQQPAEHVATKWYERLLEWFY